MILRYKKIRETKSPKRENPSDSGLDIFAPEKYVLLPGETKLIETGLVFDIPKVAQQQLGFKIVPELQVRSKSGLAYHNGLIVLNSPGTMDNSYMKELGVLMHNSSRYFRCILEGQKIAQIVMNYVLIPELKQVEEIHQSTERGGFGSTGKGL